MADVYIPDDSDTGSEEGALSLSSGHSAVLIGSDDDEIIDVEAVSQRQVNNVPQVNFNIFQMSFSVTSPKIKLIFTRSRYACIMTLHLV